MILLRSHLAHLLFADRRYGDAFMAGIAAARIMAAGVADRLVVRTVAGCRSRPRRDDLRLQRGGAVRLIGICVTQSPALSLECRSCVTEITFVVSNPSYRLPVKQFQAS
jgi:hypothetical protein